VLRCAALDELAGAELWLKCENLQHIGAFKARGAMHALIRLDPEVRARGVVTYSSGNHAQAVALAARDLGVRADIAMPEDAPPIKLEMVRKLGAHVVLAGTTSDHRRETAHAMARERDATIIEPFDHPDIICGQGTATLELLEEVDARTKGEGLDALFVPVGGGGVLAGACLAARAQPRPPAIYSVEPVGCDSMARSLEAGERVPVTPGPTLGDGLKPTTVGALNFEIARNHVHGSFRVDDDELAIGLVRALFSAKILVEPSGAAGLTAAVRESARLEPRPTRVGVMLTGGNIEPSLLARLITDYADRR
jgi:threonine dehydratase